METLPKDVVEKVVNELSPSELINFCISSASKNICKDNAFWSRRFKKDYSFLVPYFSDLSTNAKKRYLETFLSISQEAEKAMKKIIDWYGEEFVKNFLNYHYQDHVYTFFYNYILDGLKHIVNNGNREELNEYYRDGVYHYDAWFDDSFDSFNYHNAFFKKMLPIMLRREEDMRQYIRDVIFYYLDEYILQTAERLHLFVRSH